jgi:hypothetical protein
MRKQTISLNRSLVAFMLGFTIRSGERKERNKTPYSVRIHNRVHKTMKRLTTI